MSSQTAPESVNQTLDNSCQTCTKSDVPCCENKEECKECGLGQNSVSICNLACKFSKEPTSVESVSKCNCCAGCTCTNCQCTPESKCNPSCECAHTNKETVTVQVEPTIAHALLVQPLVEAQPVIVEVQQVEVQQVVEKKNEVLPQPKVLNIFEMGFGDEEVKKAMTDANNNQTLALEYLTSNNIDWPLLHNRFSHHMLLQQNLYNCYSELHPNEIAYSTEKEFKNFKKMLSEIMLHDNTLQTKLLRFQNFYSQSDFSVTTTKEDDFKEPFLKCLSKFKVELDFCTATEYLTQFGLTRTEAYSSLSSHNFDLEACLQEALTRYN